MNRLQYLLGKLAEEASELAQIALKTQQFGPNSYHTNFTNEELLKGEVNDVFTITGMICEEFGLDITLDLEMIGRKSEKVDKYYEISKQLGQVVEEG